MKESEDIIINNQNRCTLHPNKNLEFLCLDCKFMPCCSLCTSRKGEHHGHKTDSLESSASNIHSLINDFKDNIYPKLIERKENDQILLKESNETFKEIQSQNDDNNNLLKNEFKQIHNILSFVELDIEKQLSTNLDQNILINTIITSSINNDNKIISTILNNNNNSIIDKLNYFTQINNQQDNDDNDDCYQIDTDTIELIKQYQNSLLILKNSNNINNLTKLKEYNNQILKFDNQTINNIKNSFKSIYSFVDNNNNNNNLNNSINENKFINIWNHDFFIYSENDESSILSGDFESLAFKDNCDILSKVKKLPNNVMLLNGFNQKLTKGIIPVGIKELHIGDIKQELNIDSIPNTVTTVTLCNGFNQKLTKGIIPESVKVLVLGDIKQELIIDSIPNTVTTVSLCDGFNQKLTKGIIPEGVKELLIGNIKQELIIDSIPNTVKTLTLCDGFNQKLTKGIIPESVKELLFGGIKHDLMIGSIPNTLNNVYILKSCKKLIESFVPKNVKIIGY